MTKWETIKKLEKAHGVYIFRDFDEELATETFMVTTERLKVSGLNGYHSLCDFLSTTLPFLKENISTLPPFVTIERTL